MPPVPSLFRENRKTDGRCPSTITGFLPGQTHDRQGAGCLAPTTPDNFTIFEGTSEIQRMIIGRAVTGLNVR
jgi:hypothetical protein